MFEAVFSIAVLVLLWGARKRYERREAVSQALEKLERVQDFSEVYGGDVESPDEEKRRKILKQGGSRGERIRFELTCWSLHIGGAALAVVAAAMWLGEDQSHSLNDLAKYLFCLLVVTWFAWVELTAKNKIARLERDVVWLKHVLRDVHKSAVSMRKTSADEYVELNDRIDKRE